MESKQPGASALGTASGLNAAVEMSLADFRETFYEKLEVDSYLQCLPDCFEDMCSGWTQETFRQVIMTMTRKGAAPIKLWLDSPEEMTVLSNKRQAIHDIFKLMDSSQIGRIDTLELFAPILISIQGKWETILTNAMVIYGFNCETEFSRDEFHFFLDCFFRGLLKLLIVVDKADPVLRGPALSIFSRKKPVPLHAGKRLSPPDLDKLVSQVFPPNIEVLERADFIEAMKQPKEIAEYIKYFNEMFLKSVAAFRQKILDRIHITQFIRKSLLDVQRVVYTKIIEIETAKLALQASTNSQSQPQPSPVMSNGGGSNEQNPQAIQSKNVVQIGDNPRRVFHKDSQRRMWKAVE